MEKQKNFIIYLGLKDKDTKKQILSDIQSYQKAENILKSFRVGFSIVEQTGGYFHENGEYVTEKSLQIKLFLDNLPKVERIALELKKQFNQESIIIEQNISAVSWI